jgi:hypothetical protein
VQKNMEILFESIKKWKTLNSWYFYDCI